MQEEFEDTKGVIRICKSKKDNQHNDQKKEDKQQICTSFKQTRCIEKPNQSVPEVDYETE